MLTLVLVFPLIIMMNYIGVAWYLILATLLLMVRLKSNVAVIKILKILFIPLIAIEVILYYQPGLLKVFNEIITFFNHTYHLFLK
jgi:hypothetical protein